MEIHYGNKRDNTGDEHHMSNGFVGELIITFMDYTLICLDFQLNPPNFKVYPSAVSSNASTNTRAQASKNEAESAR
jgi:hypothetical protein